MYRMCVWATLPELNKWNWIGIKFILALIAENKVTIMMIKYSY